MITTPHRQLILSIDTSCDDTSAAVTDGVTVLSNIVASQTELHKKYGGVFPTVAKLAHTENIAAVVRAAQQRAQITPSDLSAVAVTEGPGLAPALEIGITFAEEFAHENHLPLYAVNHMEGHLLSVLAEPARPNIQGAPLSSRPIPFPVLSVLVSGGHTEFVLVTALGQYRVLGTTLDDAAGECLDKIGRMLNLGYPAGPVIETFARLGNPQAVTFPLPLTQIKDFNLSFSGLKTFARNTLEAQTQTAPLSQQQLYDFCASAQYGVFRHICYKLAKILEQYAGITEIWLGGGVAANTKLRSMLRKTSKRKVRVPYTKRLCADNAAMIGVAASRRMMNSEKQTLTHIERKPRLSLSTAE